MEGTYVRTDPRQTVRHSIARQHIHKAASGADEQELQVRTPNTSHENLS